MSNTFKPTPYQVEIFKHIWHGKGNAVIEAVAGSGKTTTIVRAIEGIKNLSKFKTVFVSFNRHIAVELKKRLPKSIRSVTTHSIGKSWIRKHNGGIEPKIDQYGLRTKKALQQLAVSHDWFNFTDLQYSEK